MIQQFHFWVFIQRKQNHSFEKIDASPCSLQHYLQGMKTIWVCVSGCMDKGSVAWHSAIKKDILPAVTTRMDLEGILISEVSKTEKDKYCMILLICGI